VVDFEKDYIRGKRCVSIQTFLKHSPDQQYRIWRDAWGELQKAHDLEGLDEPILLLIHGAIVRGAYGVRAAYDLEKVRDFKPDLVITLIDNVYDLWWRTESRAGGSPWMGRPTLEQLLTARRTEQLVGDQIANHLEPPVRHVLLSVHHPCESAARFILGDPPIIYMAFPISEPRRMLRSDPRNRTGVALVDALHTAAFALQRREPEIVFVSPLTIDERPLSDLLDSKDALGECLVGEAGTPGGEPRPLREILSPESFERVLAGTLDEEAEKASPALRFDREGCRWSTDAIGAPETLLTPGPPADDDRKPIPLTRIWDAAGTIRTDVAWRDSRLVLQADALAVFCPVMNNAGKLARGVQFEMGEASHLDIPMSLYQDPTQDQGAFEAWFGTPGSMGMTLVQEQIHQCDSLEQMLRRAVELARAKHQRRLR
jgi:hypothetical protein